MSYGTKCDEPGCKEYAKYSICVALRSRPDIPVQISEPLNYVCENHKHQTMDEFLPQQTWDKFIESKKLFKSSFLPIRSISYLLIKPFKQKDYDLL